MERNSKLENLSSNARTQINYALLMYTSAPKEAKKALKAARDNIDKAIQSMK